MKQIIVISPKCSDISAKNLADYLDADYENPYETKNRDYSKYDLVFKYGFSRPIKAKNKSVINKTKSVEKAIDKLQFFLSLDYLEDIDCITPPFTTDKKLALDWIKEGDYVVARTDINSNNGKGLVYCTSIEELNNTETPLYTKYIEHTNEFRVNVWKNKVVSVYDKRRTNQGTFKFVLYQGQEDHPQLINIVNKVYEKIGLDWYGLDVVCDSKGRLHVLEANSAPILFPYTIKKLGTIIKNELNKGN